MDPQLPVMTVEQRLRLYKQRLFRPSYKGPALARPSPESAATSTKLPILPVGHEICAAVRKLKKELSFLHHDRDRNLYHDPLALAHLVRDSIPDADQPARRLRNPCVAMSFNHNISSDPFNASAWNFGGAPVSPSPPIWLARETQLATYRHRFGLCGEGPPGETREERNKRVWRETRGWYRWMSQRQQGRPCGVLDEWGREKEGAECMCAELGREDDDDEEEEDGGEGQGARVSASSSNSKLNGAAVAFVPPPSSESSWTPPSTRTGSVDNESVDGEQARASSPAADESFGGEQAGGAAAAAYVFGSNDATDSDSDPDSNQGRPYRAELEFNFRSEALSSFFSLPGAAEQARASSSSAATTTDDDEVVVRVGMPASSSSTVDGPAVSESTSQPAFQNLADFAAVCVFSPFRG